MNSNTNKIDELDIYGDQVKEVLSNPPSSLFIWGNWIVFTFLIIVLFLTWLIKFPDVIVSDVMIVSKNKPIDIIAEIDGNLSHIFVGNKDTVKTGDKLAIIANTTDYQDLLVLETFLDSVFLKFGKERNLNLSQNLKIGSLQHSLNKLERIFNQRYVYQSISPEKNDRIQIEKQIDKMYILSENIDKQTELYKKHIDVFDAEFSRQAHLYQNGSIAESDFENTKILSVDKQRALEKIKQNKAQNAIAIEKLKREYAKLSTNEKQMIESYQLDMKNILSTLKAEIEEWKQTHIIYAKQSGVATFLNYFKEKQYIQKGTPLFSIINKSHDFSGEGYLAHHNSGKVRASQEVVIKLLAFPEQEYGYLKGYIEDISIVSSNDKYLVSITIPNGLKTNYSKTLPFKPTYKGTAQIITEDLRLIERIFYELKNIFHNN